MKLLINEVENKEIELKTSSNIEYHDNFIAKIVGDNGKIKVKSDLSGLKR